MIAIDVEPASVFAYEAACFVQAVRATADLVAGDEFDDGASGSGHLVALDLKAKPARFLAFVEQWRGWSRAGVPGCQQVWFKLVRVSTVTRAHQGFGSRCNRTGVIGATTGGIGFWQATAARCYYLFFRGRQGQISGFESVAGANAYCVFSILSIAFPAGIVIGNLRTGAVSETFVPSSKVSVTGTLSPSLSAAVMSISMT